MSSTAARLALVQQAIDDLVITGVTQYQDGGKSFSHNNLDQLRRLELSLVQQLAAESRGNFRLAVPLRPT